MNGFDPDLLRTLVAFADTGTLSQAAGVVGRTPSAVTAQMQRLEQALGVALFAAVGRNRVLTEAGERFVGHARRILALHNEAWLSVSDTAADGKVGIGVTQDFVDEALPRHLNLFARLYPRTRIDLRVGRTVELTAEFDAGRIDVLVAIRAAFKTDEVTVVREPMLWLSAEQGQIGGLKGVEGVVPLALLDPPCVFRDAALRTLEESGADFTIAATSSTLAGVWAAVRAGLALSVRTQRSLVPGVERAPAGLHLPALPAVEFCLRMRHDAPEPARRLAAILADELHRKR